MIFDCWRSYSKTYVIDPGDGGRVYISGKVLPNSVIYYSNFSIFLGKVKDGLEWAKSFLK